MLLAHRVDPGSLCDRAASLADQGRRYGGTAAILPDLLMLKCGAANVTSNPVTGNGTSKCDWRIRTTGDLIDFMGHMHTRGKSFRMILNPGTPKETVLLDIPSWNFDWQINYQPVTPIPVEREIGQANLLEKRESRAQFGENVARDLGFASA